MGQTFFPILVCKLRPLLRLVCSFSSGRVGQCPKNDFAPFWKFSVRGVVTPRCTRLEGNDLSWWRQRQFLQLHRSLTSDRTMMARTPPQTVMRTFVEQYSSNVEKKQESAEGQEHSRKSEEEVTSTPEQLSLFKRFKQMYRDYWYVLIPVHVVTSVGWFGAFYYMCISGVDVVAVLESLNVSEKIINPLRDSKAGYLALSYALYKIATPLRYTITLGGTTVSINYLKKWGYIKPIPPREKLKEMYDEKKENFIERKDAIIKGTAEQFKERKESFMKTYRTKK